MNMRDVCRRTQSVHQFLILMGPASYPRRILGKCETRILIQSVEMAFEHSGFRRGAKGCKGAPRGNDFLSAPLGAGIACCGRRFDCTLSRGWRFIYAPVWLGAHRSKHLRLEQLVDLLVTVPLPPATPAPPDGQTNRGIKETINPA